MPIGATSDCVIGVLEPFLSKVSALIEDGYSDLRGNHRELCFLRDEISSIRVGLEMMTKEEESDPQGSEWMSQLREIIYDAEDCVDTFVHPSIASTNDGLINTIVNKVKQILSQIKFANELKELKQRALDVSDRRKRYKMDPSTAIPKDISIDLRLPALFVDSENLVGIESQQSELVEWIRCNDGLRQQCAVLSIVGFGGLGKTTLANEVFKLVKSEFDTTAFLSASRRQAIPAILRHVLMQIRKGSEQVNIPERPEDPHLAYTETVDSIREFLKNKRFLIVVDDIWSKQAWHQIQCSFPTNNKGSRVITTTRIEDVAKYCSSRNIDKIHQMHPLDIDNSRNLFFRRLFKQDQCPVYLKETADTILKRCEGLPLAIVNMASLLSVKTMSKDVWESVLSSVATAVEQDHELQVVHRILFLSYYDLPCYLKLCFLDLGSFPEDYEIDIERLKRRWIAEGFVAQQRGQCLEDTAQNYINELINRNMVQPLHIGHRRDALACRVHDIMLDLIVYLSEKENFSTLMDGRNLPLLANKIRRLSLHGNIDYTLWQGSKDLSHVRSLSAFGDVKNMPPLLNFRCLRVFDMENCSNMGMACIKNIGRLTQLRYICLRGLNIIKIPSEIGQLKLLRTLDLRVTGIEDLPASVSQLDQLICLSVPHRATLPNGIEKMVSLEELSNFNTRKNSTEIVQQLGSLTKLKILVFTWCEDAALDNERNFKASCVSSLSKLGFIKRLHIDSMERCSLDFLDSWYPPPSHMQELVVLSLVPFFTRLPQWINLSKLTTLHIFVVKLGVEDMQVLEGLPLINLHIDATEPMKETHTISHTGFQNLKVFYFCLLVLFGVPGLRFEAGAAPCLEVLILTFDAKMVISAHGAGFNCGISHLSCLRDLKVYINCQGASAAESEAAEAAIRSEAALLPNCPTPSIWQRSM